MPLSYAQTLGNGIQRNFDVPFEYLSKTHIRATVDGDEVPFTWVDTYRLLTSTAPPVNSVVEVRRVTPREQRLVTFTDGSTLVESDLNTSTLQSFFLAQEAFDTGDASMAITQDGQYSAQTRRISNVGNPINPQDVATKAWSESGMTSQLALTIAAKDLAVTAKNTAESAVSGIVAERQAAQQARSDAQAARDSASGHRLNAQNAQAATESARDATLAKLPEINAAATTATNKANEATQAASTATAKAAEATAAAAVFDADPWAWQPIGVLIPVATNLVGVAAPPTNKSYRYIKLTAADAYNSGVLTSEAVSGAAPLVNATATVSLAGSPLNGQSIRLINTERRFLRAGDAGTAQDDAFQGHHHAGYLEARNGDSGGSNRAAFTANILLANMVREPISDGVNGPPRTANETRPRNIGVTYFMRIK